MATTIEPASESPILSANNQATIRDALPLSTGAATAEFWRDVAPQGVLGDNFWSTWQRHLDRRPAPKPLHKLCASDASPLNWGIAPAELSPKTVELLALVDQLIAMTNGKSRRLEETVEQILAGWLEDASTREPSIDLALECLAVAHALPQVADCVTKEFWWELVDALWHVIATTASWRIDEAMPPEQGLAQQMLAGELPLTLAYLLPEMRPLYKLRAAARDALTEGIEELLNGNGLMQGQYLSYQRPLMASWTRCRAIGGELKKGCWNRKADEEFRWLATQAIGLSSPQGTPLLGRPHDESWSADFLACLVALGGDDADAAAARSIFGKKLTASLKGKQVNVVPDTSDECEWAGVAYMRTEWERSAPTVAVDYSTPDLQIEVWTGPQQLITGAWSWETTLDGRRMEPIGSWDQICWFSDDDVDYLELSIELTDGARLERQIMLARDELLLLLADYVLDTGGGKIGHRYRLPLADGTEFSPEKETREGRLEAAGKSVARVLPLALPEWRTDPRIGTLHVSDGLLQLEQARDGTNLACPMLIDLKRSRVKKPCTWRQLTIAESLEIQPHDVAVGYRAQCGKQQWLIYRSLAKAANRSVLGQNLSSECMIGRFLAPSGELDELLEIEG